MKRYLIDNSKILIHVLMIKRLTVLVVVSDSSCLMLVFSQGLTCNGTVWCRACSAKNGIIDDSNMIKEHIHNLQSFQKIISKS